MGTYQLSADEIADRFESIEFEKELEGDFTIEAFIQGAVEYLKRLRKQGASLYRENRNGCPLCKQIKEKT